MSSFIKKKKKRLLIYPRGHIFMFMPKELHLNTRNHIFIPILISRDNDSTDQDSVKLRC